MKQKAMGFLCTLIAACSLFGGLRGVAVSEKRSYSWYCVHVKDHRQPSLDPELEFVEGLGAFYADRSHAAPDAEDKVVYLTFDAGYENGNIAKVLDTLREEGAVGCFFILGSLLQKHPELVRRMAEEGHTVGNHTFRHKNMSLESDQTLQSELRELETLYYEVTKRPLCRLYRPPEGRFNRQNLQCASELGYKTVFWSFAYPDWDNNRQMSEERALQIILDNIHNGEIMLLHPTSNVNAAVLGRVLRELKSQGYRFGRLEELTGATYAEIA